MTPVKVEEEIKFYPKENSRIELNVVSVIVL